MTTLVLGERSLAVEDTLAPGFYVHVEPGMRVTKGRRVSDGAFYELTPYGKEASRELLPENESFDEVRSWQFRVMEGRYQHAAVRLTASWAHAKSDEEVTWANAEWSVHVLLTFTGVEIQTELPRFMWDGLDVLDDEGQGEEVARSGARARFEREDVL